MIELEKSGYVISDLHLFTHRTVIDDHLDNLHQAAAEADFFVLNGDVFDFRWTTLGSIEKTTHAAIDELETFAQKYPQCRFFYIMGNHDAFEPFARHLDELAERRDNFFWHPSHLRIGNQLFLHGDLALDDDFPDPFQRELLPAAKKKGRSAQMGYRMIVAARVHRFICWFHSPQWCARRILRSLREHHPNLAEGLSDVYFGHIHNPFSNFRYDGVTFHNTGSTVRHLRCRMLAVRT
jgi:UDP-2,3-diacylglucosamine hydrolase